MINMSDTKPAASSSPENTRESSGIWPFVPAVLLGGMVAGLFLMMRIATDDPNFAVEKDYYQKALDWDATQAQSRRNRTLGWNITLQPRESGKRTELRARVLDKDGKPVALSRLTVEAFPNAAANQRTTLTLTPTAAGDYQAFLSPSHRGLWEFRFVVDAPGGRFTQILREDLKMGGET